MLVGVALPDCGQLRSVAESELPDVVRLRAVGSTADWLRAGLSRRQLENLIERNALIRMRRGVYATASVLAASEKKPAYRHSIVVAAAQRATVPGTVASHTSAALMHDIQLLKRPPAGLVALTRPRGSRIVRGGTGGVDLHAAALPPHHVTTRYKVPVTTAARTVADLARTSSFMAAVVVADSALHKRKTTKPELTRVLADCARWQGTVQARRVAEFSDGRAESVLESCARVVFAEHGLPPPDLQVELGAERFAGRVDFYWRDFATVAEADGEVKYTTSARSVAQLERDQLLRAAGFRVVHFTWQQLFREQLLVISWIKQAFRGELY